MPLTKCCRECRKVIVKGEPVMVRDGRKMRFLYHADCFSGGLPEGPAHSCSAMKKT